MAALAGEPWRGLALARLNGNVTATVSITDIAPLTASGDQPDWDYQAGIAVTLRYEEAFESSTPINAREVKVFLPGSNTQIGATWTPSPSGGVATRTFHFDDDPLSEVLGALRAGMLELWVRIADTAHLNPWDINSRGGSPGTARTNDWARGYVRARSKLSAFGVSNVALGGAEPATFAYPDPTHNRVTLDATLYRAEPLTLEHRSGGAATRSQTDAASTSATRDYSWSATSGLTGRVNNDYPVGAAAVRAVLPARDFGGDNETAWASTGHAAGWSAVDDRTLEEPDRITVDPTLTLTRHFQLNDNAFGTPPGSKDAGTDRLTADLGFVAARVTNARGEGINQAAGANLGVSYSLRDNGSLVSAIVATDQATVQQGGEGGWGPLMAWASSLPGGGWTNSVTFKDEAGTQGTASHLFTLLASDPRMAVEIVVEPTAEPKDHLSPGDELRVSAKVRSLNDPVTPDADSMKLVLTRIRSRKAQHYDGAAWVDTGAGALLELAMTASPQDPRVFERTIQTDASWGYGVFTAQLHFKVNATPYSMRTPVVIVGEANRHAKHAFDAIGIFK